jgi:hypothetical protein
MGYTSESNGCPIHCGFEVVGYVNCWIYGLVWLERNQIHIIFSLLCMV